MSIQQVSAQCENQYFAPNRNLLSQEKIRLHQVIKGKDSSFYEDIYSRIFKYREENNTIQYLDAAKTKKVYVEAQSDKVIYAEGTKQFILRENRKGEILISISVSPDAQLLAVHTSGGEGGWIYLYRLQSPLRSITPIETITYKSEKNIEKFEWAANSQGIYYSTRSLETSFFGEIMHHKLGSQDEDTVYDARGEIIKYFYVGGDNIFLIKYDSMYSDQLYIKTINSNRFRLILNDTSLQYLGYQNNKWAILKNNHNLLIQSHERTYPTYPIRRFHFTERKIVGNKLFFIEKDGLYRLGLIENLYEKPIIHFLDSADILMSNLSLIGDTIFYRKGTLFKYKEYQIIGNSIKQIVHSNFEIEERKLPNGHTFYCHKEVYKKHEQARNRGKKIPIPTLVYVYGGFGLDVYSQIDNYIWAWIEMGGIVYVPDVSPNNKGADKKKTIEAVAEATQQLIDLGWTDKKHLAIYGVSHGGWLAAKVALEYPNLWEVCITEKGLHDLCNMPIWDNYGLQWLEEFGKDTAILRELSTIHAIKKDTSYPTFLIITAKYDERVNPLHSYLLFATLNNSKNVYLYEEDMTHIEYSNRVNTEKYALIYSFLYKHLNMEDKMLNIKSAK